MSSEVKSGPKTNEDRLLGLMGGENLARQGSLSQDLFGEVIKEIKEERAKANKVKAREYLEKAMDLWKQKEKAEREFRAALVKIDKELGKTLNQIEGMLSGRPAQDEAEKEDAPAA